MSSRKRSATEALDASTNIIPYTPAPGLIMGVVQSTVRHWTALFSNWIRPQGNVVAQNEPSHGQNEPRPLARSIIREHPLEKRGHEGAGSAGDRGAAGENATKRRRVVATSSRHADPTSSRDTARIPRRPTDLHRIQNQRMRQSFAPLDSRSRHGGRNFAHSQAFNRSSIHRARAQERPLPAGSAGENQASSTRTAVPLSKNPQSREEIDDLFMPKSHGLLERAPYPTPDASPAQGSPETRQSGQYDARYPSPISSGSPADGMGASIQSAPFILHPGDVGLFTGSRSTRIVRPIRREDDKEVMSYAKRIEALMRDDELDEPRLSARKQAELDEKRRLREEERLRKEKEAEEKRLQEEAEARLKRRIPKKPLIQPLEDEWEARVDDAIYTNNQGKIVTTSIGGTELIPKDFRTLLGARSWLNDEIINAYIEWVVDSANKLVPPNKAVGKDKPVPKFITHNSFFYENITKKGPTSTDRLMKRKGAPGKSLMQVDSVIVPICRGSHWTVGVVRPCVKTIEYFDSFGGHSSTGKEFRAHMRAWLAHQLADGYVASEWTEPDTGCAAQTNGWDCGVFVCTNAFCVAFGLETSCYVERDLGVQRRRIAAVLINRGFHGDFAWAKGGW